MSESRDAQEKRMISDTGYEVKHAFRINGKEVLFAENPQAENKQCYLTCVFTQTAFIGEYAQAQTSDSYLESVQSFTAHINTEALAVQKEMDAIGLSTEIFTKFECYPHDYGENIAGKYVPLMPLVSQTAWAVDVVCVVHCRESFHKIIETVFQFILFT